MQTIRIKKEKKKKHIISTNISSVSKGWFSHYFMLLKAIRTFSSFCKHIQSLANKFQQMPQPYVLIHVFLHSHFT